MTSAYRCLVTGQQRRPVVIVRPDDGDAWAFIATGDVTGGLEVTGRVSRHGDQLMLDQLQLRPSAGVQVSAETMRAVKIGAIMSRVREKLLLFAEEATRQRGPDDPPWMGTTPATTRRRLKQSLRRVTQGLADQPLKRGRSGYPEDHYRRVALIYLELLAEGVHQGILAAVGDRMATEMSESQPRPVQTVRTWIYQARRRGFLTGGERGRAAALPGPRLDPGPTKRKG
jgi:hypothetical protein